jgi:1,4-dihydroxy-2-naphthoate octaprenyltransferase
MFRKIFNLSHPVTFLLAALTYLLGASIPVYLGKPFKLVPFWLGLAVILFAQLTMNLLAEAFRPHNEPLIEDETPGQKETLRNNLLYISYASLGVSVAMIFLLFINQSLPTLSFFFFLLSLILIILYAVPPFRLLDHGFGELVLAAHIAYVIPSIGFLLEFKEMHRLLAFVTIPLISLALAYFLVLDFPAFSMDQKYQRATLLRRLSWEVAVPLHHSLIIFAYACFATAPLFGFSISLTSRVFLTLPFALFQIYQLNSIARGNPPNWRLLTFAAFSVFFLTVYFLVVTFWIE